MSVKRVEVVVRSQWNALPLPLRSCDSWMFVKQNPDRKKNSWCENFVEKQLPHSLRQYTVISPNFLVLKFCGKAQFLNSLGNITKFHLISWCENFVECISIVSGESPETLRKLYLFTKFLQQEIRWNYGI